MSATPILQADPRAGYLAHKDEIDAAIAAALASGRYILGPEVAAFETAFAAYLGVGHAIGVANGTDALVLALRALGIGPGDTVATVSHTAVATVAAVELAGARPLLVDIDADACTMSASSLARAFAAGPIAAVIPVHLYGLPADLDAIATLARAHGARLIEDCAQSIGARLGARRTGSIGDVACFSFYPTKNLGALGDGGLVATDDAGVAERLRMLRQYGWRERYVSDVPGLNSRLDELQAAVLRVRLRHLDADNQRRQAIAALYDAELAGARLALPARRRDADHVFHQYVVRHAERDRLAAELARRAIGTNIHYPVPVHLQPAYRGRVPIAPGGLPETERAAPEVLSLPIYPELGDPAVRRVAAAVKESLLAPALG